MEEAGLTASAIAAIGITNQRETTVLWDRATGEPLAQRHRLAGPADGGGLPQAPTATAPNRWWPERTGLLIDPYFSATKLGWLLDTFPVRASGRSGASCASAPSTASCCSA